MADSLRDNPWARVIKASDFTDNGVGLMHTTGPRLHRLAGKYAPLVPVLADLIARPDTRWTPRPRSASWASSTGPPTGSPPFAARPRRTCQ